MAEAALRTVETFPRAPAPRISIPAACAMCSLRRLTLCEGSTTTASRGWGHIAPVERRHAARNQILIEGEPANDLSVISRGWAFRYKMLADGRRQIIDFLIPGDVLTLPKERPIGVSYSVEALTSVVTCSLPSHGVRDAFDARDDRHGWVAGREAQIERRVMEHFASVGRRDAMERLAHLLLEIHWRMTVRGLTIGNSCVFPASQHQIGDAIALTNAHVSRLLRRLKEQGIVEASNSTIEIHDIERLRDLCAFDDSYLPPDDDII